MAPGRRLSDRRVRLTTLDNGVRVVTERVPHARGVAFGLRVDGGARLEPPERAGICHLIEHLVHKGSERRSAREIAELFDSIGGSMDAYTSREYTAYGFRVLPEHLEPAMEVLGEMLLTPRFDAEDLELERSVVLEEYRGMLDAPEEFVHEAFCRSLWPRHALGRSILGEPEVLNGLTRDDLLDYLARTYVPSAFICAAAGDVEHDRIVALVERTFGAMAPGAFAPCSLAPDSETGRVRLERDTEQVYLCLGRDAPGEEHPDRWALRVVNFVLGQGLSSRLFQEIREKRGLVYSIGSDYSTFRGVGLFCIGADTSLRHLDQVLELIDGELRRLAADGITPVELERSRQAVRAGILLAQDDLGTRMGRLARGIFYQGRVTPLVELARRVEAITLDECRDVCRRWLDADRMALTAVGPFHARGRTKRRQAAVAKAA